jgi:hypothetical protein
MKITLNTGRGILLDELYQWHTYRGVLAGLPDRRKNAEHIEEVLESASEHCVLDARPWLIEPRVTPIKLERPPGKRLLEITGQTAAEFIAAHERAQYERLPYMACVGVFESDLINPSGHNLSSSLTIVWFQDSLALPIDAGVLEQIRKLDWDALARDWSP